MRERGEGWGGGKGTGKRESNSNRSVAHIQKELVPMRLRKENYDLTLFMLSHGVGRFAEGWKRGRRNI